MPEFACLPICCLRPIEASVTVEKRRHFQHRLLQTADPTNRGSRSKNEKAAGKRGFALFYTGPRMINSQHPDGERPASQSEQSISPETKRRQFNDANLLLILSASALLEKEKKNDGRCRSFPRSSLRLFSVSRALITFCRRHRPIGVWLT